MRDQRIRRTILGLLSVFMNMGTVSRGETGEGLADQLPRIPAKSVEETLGDLAIDEDFQIEVVAAEPLIGSPVAVEWDAAGDLFVCEMRGYSEDREAKLSKVIKLLDSNKDGVFDKRIVFADQLHWPTAIYPYKNGLFVADAPHIYYFQDTDGDGQADHKEIALTGFGTGNVQGLLNSFRWGLDNRIHVAVSSAGGRVAKPDGTVVDLRGRDLALDPEIRDFVVTTGGGQHGMCFDEWGRKFVCSNSDHIQQVILDERDLGANSPIVVPKLRKSIAADGPQAEVYRISPIEPWRLVRTRMRVGGVVGGPIEGGGRPAGYFTGASGVTIYKGDGWPESWKHMAIIGDVGGNLVHRKKLELKGLEFVAKRIDENREFIASKDIWFRPVQFAQGPDGNILVIDFCREVIEHPKSLPPQIKQHLDLTAGRNRGRLLSIHPKNQRRRASVDLAKLGDQELVAILAHPNAWHRETASRLLYERQSELSVRHLEHLVTTSKSPQARVHALYALDGLNRLSDDSVLAGLQDAHSQVVRHAMKLMRKKYAALPQKFIEVVKRRRAAATMELKVELAHSTRHMSASNRLEILSMLHSEGAENYWLRIAMRNALSSTEIVDFLITVAAATKSTDDQFVLDLISQSARQVTGGEVARLVDFLINDSGKIGLSHRLMALRVLEKRQRGDTAEQLVQAANKQLMKQVLDVLTHGDRSRPSEQLISLLRFTDWETARPVLEEALSNANTQSFRAAVVVAVSFQTQESIQKLIDHIANGHQEEDFVINRLCESVVGRENLLDSIEAGRLSSDKLSLERLETLASSTDESIRKRAAIWLGDRRPPSRQEIVAKYLAALEIEGSATAGQKVFKAKCASCHQAGSQGTAIGPNLASMQTRGDRAIIQNIFDPNAEVNPAYVSYEILTKEDRIVRGLIKSESSASIEIQNAEGKSTLIPRDQIERVSSSGRSLMPEGLEKDLDFQQLANLLAYLREISHQIKE